GQRSWCRLRISGPSRQQVIAGQRLRLTRLGTWRRQKGLNAGAHAAKILAQTGVVEVVALGGAWLVGRSDSDQKTIQQIKLVKRVGQVLAMQIWVGGRSAGCPEAHCSQQHGGGAIVGLEGEKAHHAISLGQGGWCDGGGE